MKADLEVVITSYNQREMINDAVKSVAKQTLLPKKIIIIDDGSDDKESQEELRKIENTDYGIEIIVERQANKGVSAARNHGIKKTESKYVMVFDGDDILDHNYCKNVLQLLEEDKSMIAASSWMKSFGALFAEIRPDGGDIRAFLSHNCCPATHIFRREAWEKCGGYDEQMKTGFEDWDYFLSMLETVADSSIGIVNKPLMFYRTAPASSNIQSMNKRIEIMRYLIRKHKLSYEKYLEDALLGLEKISMFRLAGWESEMALSSGKHDMSEMTKSFLSSPTYGDGGMAAAVRIASR